MKIIDISDLIGVPYKINGRSLSGLDCMGLAIEVEKRFGYTLPDKKDFRPINVKDRNFNALAEAAIPLCPVVQVEKAEVESDIILFQDGNKMLHHIGVYLGYDKFIHCNKYGVHIEKLSSFPETIGRVYRWL